jgi:hypothetical protein
VERGLCLGQGHSLERNQAGQIVKRSEDFPDGAVMDPILRKDEYFSKNPFLTDSSGEDEPNVQTEDPSVDVRGSAAVSSKNKSPADAQNAGGISSKAAAVPVSAIGCVADSECLCRILNKKRGTKLNIPVPFSCTINVANFFCQFKFSSSEQFKKRILKKNSDNLTKN